jgi:hypothetical protein
MPTALTNPPLRSSISDIRSGWTAVVDRVRGSAADPAGVLTLSEGTESVQVYVDTLRMVDARDGWLTWVVDLQAATTGRHRLRFASFDATAHDGARVRATAVVSGRGKGQAWLVDRWGASVESGLSDAIRRAVESPVGTREGRLSRMRFTLEDGELCVLTTTERGARR